MPSVSEMAKIDVDVEDWLKDLIHDIGVEAIKRGQLFDDLCSDADKPLYPWCTNYTRLSLVLRLVNLALP